MIVSVPREIKDQERRVALTPTGARELVGGGQTVVIETDAGSGSGFTDREYVAAGARIAATAEETWGVADMVVKVKEPVAAEYVHLRPGLVLFAYLHLAAEPALTAALVDSGTTAIAYETVQTPDRALPLLAPMSEIAGRLSVQAGAQHLMGPGGGAGVLLGGVPGTPRGRVVVIGGGVAGFHATQMAVGLGARVTVVDVSLPRLRHVDQVFGSRVDTRSSTATAIAELLSESDLVIGTVLVPGASAPKVVTLDMVEQMQEGSVLVDVAVDQGGCFEGTRPTTYSEPTYAVEGTTYYAVANMPGAVPRTATTALTNATLPYTVALADRGWEVALGSDASLAAGLSVSAGEVRDARVLAAI